MSQNEMTIDEYKKALKKSEEKEIEEILYKQLILLNLSNGLSREYKFSKDRSFRADFAYPDLKILIEVEGGTWKEKSRHTTGTGYANDCRKYNHAMRKGFFVLRYTSDMVINGEASRSIEDFITHRGYKKKWIK